MAAPDLSGISHVKQIIVTSDDFGLSAGVNAAVETGWREGILTCASIMPAGDAVGEAAAIARRNPGLQVGLHLTLVQGRAVLPPDEIPDLVDAAGCFPDDPVKTGMRYFFDKGIYKQLRREIEAQLQRAADLGLAVSHLDGHLNIHLHPTVFAFLAELMPRYGITSFRLSRERLLQNLGFSRERWAGKSIERVIFGSLAGNARSCLDHLGISYAAEVKGVLSSGCMTEAYVLHILGGLKNGVTELYFHPGVMPDTEISRRMPDYRHEMELAAITSTTVRKILKQSGIGVCNYRGEVKC